MSINYTPDHDLIYSFCSFAFCTNLWMDLKQQITQFLLLYTFGGNIRKLCG